MSGKYVRNYPNTHLVSCCPVITARGKIQSLDFISKIGTCSKFSSVQLLSLIRLFATPWTAARQASLSITNIQSPPKPMSIESVMPSNHLILCCPLLLLPSIFPNIRVFSNESAFHIRWPKCWSFSFNISPSIEHPGLISFRVGKSYLRLCDSQVSLRDARVCC